MEGSLPPEKSSSPPSDFRKVCQAAACPTKQEKPQGSNLPCKARLIARGTSILPTPTKLIVDSFMGTVGGVSLSGIMGKRSLA